MPTNDADAILDSLSPAEREALEGVLRYQSSKQIARKLGKSAKTIDQRLDRARIKLDAPTRFAAAHRYAELQATWERLLHQPSPVSPPEPTEPDPVRVPQEAVYTMGDAMTFASAAPWSSDGRRGAPKVWERDLGTLPRLALILAGALGVLALVLLGLGVAEGLKALIRGG